MPDVLSQDKIDALLTSTGAEEAAAARKRSDSGPRRVTPYDFKHPSRVSKDQTRTLENLHSNLARMMASSFSTEQRCVVDCDIAFVDQTTYAEFIMSLSNPSCSYTFTIEPLGGPAIIDFSLPVAYSFIDRQFGGTGGQTQQEGRPLTSIERTVMGRVVTRTLADLEATWESLLKIQVSDAELETNPEFMQVAAPSDTVVLIAYEVNSAHAAGLVNVCYPHFTLEPVMNYLNVRNWASQNRGRRQSQEDDRAEQLERVMAPIAAVVQAGVCLDDLVGLAEGDVLVLDAPVTSPCVVFVGTRPKFLGHPRKVDRRYAIEVSRLVAKADEQEYMSEVQKTEEGKL